MPGFVECSFPGCATSFSVSQFQAITFRAGMSVCTKHMTSEYLDQAIARAISDYACSLKVFIYYDIELSRDGEVEQLGAYTSGGEFYSAIYNLKSARGAVYAPSTVPTAPRVAIISTTTAALNLRRRQQELVTAAYRP
ncbi:hypothetical protein DL764_008119 [Monosporascus ibericus]|uniref:Uncharacterized protein n=1 Tax=Monosporascus ibericus TaxID=155417 RepID=A0A4V1X9C6_9PEZI|nr:hypothetical protein DL764_008119 [Monosporascus ibericus]